MLIGLQVRNACEHSVRTQQHRYVCWIEYVWLRQDTISYWLDRYGFQILMVVVKHDKD